jgi:hypothetical protein
VRVGVCEFAWVRVSVGAMVLMAIGGGPLIRSRMRAIARDEDSDAFRRRASDSLLRASIRTRIALGLAIIYLMIQSRSWRLAPRRRSDAARRSDHECL